MPRQTFATREFFVDALEASAYAAVQRLPQFFSRLQLRAENQKLHCFVFSYAQEGPCNDIQVTLSVLPLDNSHTKITVHGSYPNGCAFYKDAYVANALANVEAALQAAVNGEAISFDAILPKKKLAERYQQMRAKALASLSVSLKRPAALNTAQS